MLSHKEKASGEEAKAYPAVVFSCLHHQVKMFHIPEKVLQKGLLIKAGGGEFAACGSLDDMNTHSAILSFKQTEASALMQHCITSMHCMKLQSV